MVWGKQIDSKSGIRFVYPTKIGTVTTTGPGTTIDAIQTGRNVNRIHLYLFAYRNGKLEGPLWMNDRDERAWNQRHPASQQLLDDALKYLSQKQ